MTLEDLSAIKILDAIKTVRGIRDVKFLDAKHINRIMEIEKDAEKRSLLGLGKVVNTGVDDVLQCRKVCVALTDMEFDWGSHPTLVLKKGDEVVGEEVRDEKTIERLSDNKDVWFMHRNFVIYKSKLNFPEDIMKKVCHFEIPSLPLPCKVFDEDIPSNRTFLFANPSTPCDVFLKEKYFGGIDESGLGTILIGIEL